MAHLISLRRSLPYGGRTYTLNQPFEASDKHAALLVAAGFAREETTFEYNNRQMRPAPQPVADDLKPRRRRARADADGAYERRDLALTTRMMDSE